MRVTPELVDTLIYLIVAVGLVWAAIRFYQDMTRPLPDEPSAEDERPPTNDTPAST